MPASYGHNSRGVNLTNLRALGSGSLKNGYRAPYDWSYETHEQVGMGGQEMKLSSSLRHASNQLQSTTHHTVMNDMNSVEDALRVKISQTADLKALLEGALMDVISEIDALVALRQQLEGRMGRVQQKLDVNQNRLTVRSSRPARERTMDDVEKNLLTQQGMLNNFVEKVKRSVALVDKEIGQLELLRQKLEADLRDKAEALAVDEAVLSIAPDGTVDTSATAAFKKKHDCIVKTPHTWVRGTEDNLRSAQHWLQDSQRLRKAVRHAMQNSRVAEHAQSSALNDAMLKKLSSTSGLRGNIDEQLQKIRDERTRASAQRASLMEALRAKQGPLAQAKERLALRKARPCRENVNDDVEAALAKEIAHLNAATSQLSDKVRLMDREISQLDGAAATLESNMHDKHSTIGVDERVVMLDGRIHVNSPPPSSVITSRSDLSMAHTQTMHRIKDLEASLVTARRERQDMEATIRQLKDTLSSPYSP